MIGLGGILTSASLFAGPEGSVAVLACRGPTLPRYVIINKPRLAWGKVMENFWWGNVRAHQDSNE